MTADQTKRLAQLEQAYKNGILDEDTYRSVLAEKSSMSEVASAR